MYTCFLNTGPRMLGFLYCMLSGNHGAASVIIVSVLSERIWFHSFLSSFPTINVRNSVKLSLMWSFCVFLGFLFCFVFFGFFFSVSYKALEWLHYDSGMFAHSLININVEHTPVGFPCDTVLITPVPKSSSLPSWPWAVLEKDGGSFGDLFLFSSFQWGLG